MQVQSHISPDRVDALAVRAKKELLNESLFYFARRSGFKLRGKPFSFEGHEYLEEIWEEVPKLQDVTLEKAAQMGASTVELVDTFHGCQNSRYPQGVLYLLPSRSDVTEFSKTKSQSIIDENPVLQSWIQETDSTHIKEINDAYLYFRGMQSRVGLKTITVDKIIFDEVEEIKDPTLIALAEERMSHVEKKFVHRLSVPKFPDEGINKCFQASDQRYWLMKCRHCNTDNCLEDEFPACVIETVRAAYEGAIGRGFVACKKCRRQLDISYGRWVAKYPRREGRGYHLSQLFSSIVNPWILLNWFHSGKDLQTLYNDKVGLPYIQTLARLEVQQVLSLCTGALMLDRFDGPAAMGVDQPKEEGGKFHVWIGYKEAENLYRTALIGTRNRWAELDDLLKQFGVERCVVDALPDLTKARAFAHRHYGKVFLNFYSEHQKGAYKWDETHSQVVVNRTEAIDASQNVLLDRKVILPRMNEETEVFAKHCHNIAKTKEEDLETGSVRHVWVKRGEDHYRHAFNYGIIAIGDLAVYIPRIAHPYAAQGAENYDPLRYGMGGR
jgi:hypothetical protein